MNATSFATSLWRTLAPWVCLHMSGEHLAISIWNGHGWEAVALSDVPQPGLFGRYVWRIAAEHTCFRHRSFPADVIDASDLDEAVALDLRTWSPWGGGSAYFYWPTRDGDVWQVAVWAWDAVKEETLRTQVLAGSGLTLTHAIPEQAWRAAAVELASVPALLIWSVGEKLSCIGLNERGFPTRIATIGNAAEGARFRRSLGGDAERVAALLLSDDETESNATESNATESNATGADGTDISVESGVDLCIEQRMKWVMHDSRPDPIRVQQHLPAGRVLSQARLPGVRDWADPAAWKRPLAALAMLWLLWLGGSSVILWDRNTAVDAQLQQVRASASGALSLRDRVQHIKKKLEIIYGLHHRQARELRFLASLSRSLPADAWLSSVADEGESVNIQGKAKNAAAIGALLEHIHGIDHVAYLGDIRSDPVSKRELFYLRLHFSEAAE